MTLEQAKSADRILEFLAKEGEIYRSDFIGETLSISEANGILLLIERERPDVILLKPLAGGQNFAKKTDVTQLFLDQGGFTKIIKNHIEKDRRDTVISEAQIKKIQRDLKYYWVFVAASIIALLLSIWNLYDKISENKANKVEQNADDNQSAPDTVISFPQEEDSLSE